MLEAINSCLKNLENSYMLSFREVSEETKKLDSLLNDFKNKELIDEYFLKEILFNLEENENLEKKYIDIKNTIKSTGFENAANIYSLSDTSKFGGEIGWVNKLQLSKI